MEGLKEDILDFSGNIGINCKGTVTFADSRTANIYYLEEEYKMKLIVLGEIKIWDKGKRFTFFVLFQLRVYNIQTIKVKESVRYQTKKY